MSMANGWPSDIGIRTSDLMGSIVGLFIRTGGA